jgi:hypothetical protein
MNSENYWDKNNRLTKGFILIIICSIICILFLIFIMYNDGVSLILILTILTIIVISILLFFYLWSSFPHYYNINNKGIYIKFANFQKRYYWKDIKEIVEYKFVRLEKPMWTIVTRNDEKIFIDRFFNNNVVKRIINEYNSYKRKFQTKHSI